MKRSTVIGGSIFFGGLLLLWFYIFLHRDDVPAITKGVAERPAPITEKAPLFPRSIPTGWKEYFQGTYHVSLLYPDTLSVQERREPGTALTVTFQDVSVPRRGFQLFIVPYGEKEISAERFQMDIPSGVMSEIKDVVIGGVPGIKFWSTNTNIGETREVWFIHHGFLYEVTTPRESDGWLQSILKTWRFFPEEPALSHEFIF